MFSFPMFGQDPDVAAHFSRISENDPVVLAALEKLILGLKTDSLWNSILVLCVAHTIEADSLKNIRSSSYDSTNIGACAFVALRGFTTVANTKWIDTGVTTGTQNFSGNYHHMWEYQRSITPTSSSDLISAGTPAIINQNAPSPDQTLTSMGGGSSAIVNQDAPVGFIGESYTYNNVTLQVVTTQAFGTGFPIGSGNKVLIGSRGSSGGTNGANIQCAGWGLGADLGATNLNKLRNRIQTYMNDIGAGV